MPTRQGRQVSQGGQGLTTTHFASGTSETSFGAQSAEAQPQADSQPKEGLLGRFSRLVGSSVLNAKLALNTKSLNSAVQSTEETAGEKVQELLVQRDTLTDQNQTVFKSQLLLKAAAKGNPRVVEALLNAGASPTFKDQSGQTALHKAAELAYNGEATKLLIAKDAEVNAQDNQGKTPLMLAAVRGMGVPATDENVKALLQAGADVGIKNNGKTVYDSILLIKYKVAFNAMVSQVSAEKDAAQEAVDIAAAPPPDWQTHAQNLKGAGRGSPG